MNRDKQIEELAEAIFLNCHAGLFEDEAKMIAKFCYQEIDRKASEVAREIFEEIEKLKKQWTSGDINDDEFYKQLYLLEKKYTESENDNGN